VLKDPQTDFAFTFTLSVMALCWKLTITTVYKASMRNKANITIFHIHSKFDVTAEHFFGVVVTSVRVAEEKMCTLYSKTEM
jgi:hypothetical protein